MSQTDCFVTLWLPTASREKVRTRTISNCKHPEWDESFTFQIQTQVKVSRRGPHLCALPTCLLPSPPPVPASPMSFLRLFAYRLTCPINLSSHSPTASFFLCARSSLSLLILLPSHFPVLLVLVDPGNLLLKHKLCFQDLPEHPPCRRLRSRESHSIDQV